MHTISVGAARPSDLDLHLEAVARLVDADALIEPVHARLQQAAADALGEAWLNSWRIGLPRWQDTPGEINLPVLLWLHNLLEAWDLESYARARYRLLGSGGHWFAGANADAFDERVSITELDAVLQASPWRQQIPGILRGLKTRLAGEGQMRLSSV